MRCFGKRDLFGIEYFLIDMEKAYFEIWVYNKPICSFYKNNIKYQCICNLLNIVEWLNKNISNILNEEEFPLPVEANTSIEFYIKSGGFDSDDIDEFDKWFEKRQEWYFSHSWYSERAGSYLAEILFRRVNNKIEIEWDNTSLYDEVCFMNPKGLYYIDINLFEQIIDEFVSDFNTKK